MRLRHRLPSVEVIRAMMKLEPFALERYFAKHEFAARYLLSSSDCEALSMSELLEMADADTRRLWKDLTLGYTETAGHPLLRESIAEIYKGIGADNLLVVAPEEGIFLLMHALLEPGDHVICTFPGYQSLYEIARAIGCDVTMWAPNEAEGWQFDVRQLDAMIRDTTRLVVVNFPHNPTGYVPDRDDFEALVASVRQRGIYLLSDEMYRFLDIQQGATLPAGCELYEKAVSLCGLSKTFGLPGLRVGWIATCDHEIRRRMSLLRDYTTICNSAPGEILALIAVRCRGGVIARQQARILRNIAILDDFFSHYAACFTWNRPRGGSVCFPRMRMPDDTFEFCEKLVADTGIMLVPSRMFGFGDHHVRFGFGRENLPEVITRFADYVDRQLR
jgi:aspartate/methionine/tyrosine aminotransferase